MGYEAEPDERGQRLIWVEEAVLARLRTMRRPGESYSDTDTAPIVRAIEGEPEAGERWLVASKGVAPSRRHTSGR